MPQLGRLVAKGTSGRAGSVQGKPPLSGWAKAQAMMMYAQEHKERWVHNGFLQVGLPSAWASFLAVCVDKKICVGFMGLAVVHGVEPQYRS